MSNLIFLSRFRIKHFIMSVANYRYTSSLLTFQLSKATKFINACFSSRKFSNKFLISDSFFYLFIRLRVKGDKYVFFYF